MRSTLPGSRAPSGTPRGAIGGGGGGGPGARPGGGGGGGGPRPSPGGGGGGGGGGGILSATLKQIIIIFVQSWEDVSILTLINIIRYRKRGLIYDKSSSVLNELRSMVNAYILP